MSRIALRRYALAATIGNAGGAVAQSGERLPGRQKVGGSNPPSSTKAYTRELPGTGVVGPGTREPAGVRAGKKGAELAWELRR